MNHIRIRPYQFTLALIACAASFGTANANPMPGVSIYIPRVSAPPVNYGSAGRAGADSARAGADAARSSVDAARAGTGSAVFGGTVGGTDNAPNWQRGGGGAGQAGLAGRIAAAAGATVNAAPGGGYQPIDRENNGADAVAENFILAAGGVDPKPPAPPPSYSPIDRDNDPADLINSNLIMSAVDATQPSTSKSPAGKTPAGKTPAGKTPTSQPTPSQLPGPTGGTTTTVTRPGDPPDARPQLTQDQHQQQVNTANNLAQQARDLDNEWLRQDDILRRAHNGGNLTDQEQNLIKNSGGVSEMEKKNIELANQRRDADRAAREARNQANNNDSYRHVH